MRPLQPPQPVPARVSRPTHSTVVLPHAADSSMRPTVTPLHQHTVRRRRERVGVARGVVVGAVEAQQQRAVGRQFAAPLEEQRELGGGARHPDAHEAREHAVLGDHLHVAEVLGIGPLRDAAARVQRVVVPRVARDVADGDDVDVLGLEHHDGVALGGHRGMPDAAPRAASSASAAASHDACRQPGPMRPDGAPGQHALAGESPRCARRPGRSRRSRRRPGRVQLCSCGLTTTPTAVRSPARVASSLRGLTPHESTSRSPRSCLPSAVTSMSKRRRAVVVGAERPRPRRGCAR